MKIGVFDSGIGGLNVLTELLKKYPNNSYYYYGDTANLPYGDKTKDELITLSSKIIDFLIEKQVDLIIIACGTISSTCYLELKNKYNILLQDIISPTIKYLNNSNYSSIGVIGTTRTIESDIFKRVNKKVFCKKTPQFVPIIENNLLKEKELCVHENLSEFKNNIDCLVLGCTHYSLLKTEISDYLHVPLIDMGECLANSISLNNNGHKEVVLYFSKLNKTIENNIKNILVSDYQLKNN